MKYQERIKLRPMHQKVLDRVFESCRHNCETCELRFYCEQLYSKFVITNVADPVDVPGGPPSPEVLPSLGYPSGRKIPHYAVH
jgi:hypothetical protein